MADTVNDHFPRWFAGNDMACSFAADLWTAAQEWDDLKDEGKCHESLQSWLAFGKEYHPFFHAHSAILRPALLVMYLQWTAANTLDHGDRSDVAKSYMLRAGLYSVWHVMAWITGGDEHARAVGPEIYRMYGETPQEIWDEFNPK